MINNLAWKVFNSHNFFIAREAGNAQVTFAEKTTNANKYLSKRKTWISNLS